MKKIIFVSNTAWNIYNFRLELMSALRAQGYSVLAAAPEDEFTKKIIEQGFNFIPIPMNRKGTNPFQDLLLLFRLIKIYKREKPDLVIHYTIKANIYGAIACRITGIKNIVVVTGLGYIFLNKNWLYLISKSLYKFAFQFADKVVFQNTDDKQIFLQNRIVNKKQAELIAGSGINTEYFKPVIYGNNSRQILRFVFIGRILKDKGIMEFFNAVRLIRRKGHDCSFSIVGSIDRGNPASINEKMLIKNCRELNIRYVPFSQDIKKVLANTDVIVLPSYREGLSKILLEAAAMAKLIITTDIPGCRDIVDENRNGFLVPSKNSNKLAEAMQKILEIPEKKRKKMGEYSRKKTVRLFSNKIIFKQYIQVIKRIVE